MNESNDFVEIVLTIEQQQELSKKNGWKDDIDIEYENEFFDEFAFELKEVKEFYKKYNRGDL